MGEVFLAEDRDLERKVALKFLSDSLQHNASALARLRREAKSAAALDHPFICKVYEIAETEDGLAFIAMEYLEGETLADRIERDPLPLKEALRVGTESLEALKKAHGNKIVHRDLKPANIMLGRDGHVKIMDFGLAKALHSEANDSEAETREQLTGSGRIAGTPGYMSPEQLRGDPINERSDLFAFGVVLQELVTGVHPFKRDSGAETMAAILNEPPRGCEVLPAGMQPLVEKLLSKNSEDRPELELALSELQRFTESPELAELAGRRPHAAFGGPGNLPAPVSSFIGREDDLAQLARELGEHRLVTLTGVGGVGKTRLALQLALHQASDFTNGRWLVELAPVGEPSAVAPAVAAALGVEPQPGRTVEECLIEHLRGQRALLLLDNCEHLLRAAATLSEAILTSCPTVRLLATSREALGVSGERSWSVPSLEVHDEISSPAVELFVDRARAAHSSFDLGDDRAIVAEICRRLDGIPLAIELAAARMTSMTPVQVRDRLDARFRLLTGGRGSLERHQTLRHAVQWSYDLLSETERVVLHRAVVFAGGFGLPAAVAVCGDTDLDEFELLDVLDSLVHKSLIQVERVSDRDARYRMLWTIREFAEEQLALAGEVEATRDRHAEFYAEDADAHFEKYRSPEEKAALEWFDREIGNLQAAFDWAVSRGLIDAAIRMAASSRMLARMRLRTETHDWSAKMVDEARRLRHRKLPLLLTMACDSSWTRGRYDEARRFAEEAISLIDEPDLEPLVWAFLDLAYINDFEGDADEAIEIVRRGAEQPADRRDRYCLVFLLYFLSQADREAAKAMADDTLTAAKDTGMPSTIAVAMVGKSLAFNEVDPRSSFDICRHALQLVQDSGNRFCEELARQALLATERQLSPAAALRSYTEVVDRWQTSEDAMLLRTMGDLLVLLGRLGHVEAVATLKGVLNVSLDTAVPELADTVGAVRQELGEDAFDALHKKGEAMSIQAASDYAREQIARALDALERSNP